MVDGEVFRVGSIIPEQYSLTRLGGDINNIYFDSPIRQAEEVKFKVTLLWETSEVSLHGNSNL